MRDLNAVHDLNSLRMFHDVAKAGGYSAASRLTGQSRATLSRNISALEDELGTKLIERSSHSFRLTEPGQILFDRCSDILSQVVDAVAMVEDRHHEPRGVVRISVPPSILELYVGDAILDYLDANPHVRVQIDVTNREVDIRHEGIDFAIRAVPKLDYPLDFVTVIFGKDDFLFVAHPRWRPFVKPTLEETLKTVPALAWSGFSGESLWQVMDMSGKERNVAFTPRLTVGNVATLIRAVLSGGGIAVLPNVHVSSYVKSAQLDDLRFDVTLKPGIVHAVHLGHRGMRPAVRHLLDWLKLASRHALREIRHA